MTSNSIWSMAILRHHFGFFCCPPTLRPKVRHQFRILGASRTRGMTPSIRILLYAHTTNMSTNFYIHEATLTCKLFCLLLLYYSTESLINQRNLSQTLVQHRYGKDAAGIPPRQWVRARGEDHNGAIRPPVPADWIARPHRGFAPITAEACMRVLRQTELCQLACSNRHAPEKFAAI